MNSQYGFLETRLGAVDIDIADGDRAVILEQVTWGVASRMAVLYLLGGGRMEPVS